MERTATDKGTPVKRGGSRASPNAVSALTEAGAGFDVMSFAGNHSMDYGPEGFLDTIERLKKINIPVVGAGINFEEAHKPVIVERDGTKVGFLGYTSIIITEFLIAEEDEPGCAVLRAKTFYEQLDPQQGTPPLIITNLNPGDRKAMEEDIKKLRPQVDVVVVSMHAGVHAAQEIIPMYHKEAAHAAIDAGADLVLSHHAHILKGIEVYEGKTIFYGLGNFAAEHPLDAKGKIPSHSSPSFLFKARMLYGIRPNYPEFDFHPYHYDSFKTMVAKAYIADGKIQKVTYLPTYINFHLEPEVITRKDPRAQEVFDYVAKISANEELPASFSWLGDEVLISAKAGQ
jgi:poly-gamma-glutamate capsule biosynthesis protein CapA/YwtB (metallophosphatase superfamily)